MAKRAARQRDETTNAVADEGKKLAADYTRKDAQQRRRTPAARTFDRQALEEEATILERAYYQELRERAMKSFAFFVEHVLWPEASKEHYTDFHWDLCRYLEGLKPGSNLMVQLPRESRKTYIGSVAFSIYMILKDPNIRIMFVGAREDTCKKFANLVRKAFREGSPGFELFQQVFPDFVIRKGDRALSQVYQFTHPNRTQTLTDPTLYSTYLAVGGSGSRCDIMIMDDPIDSRMVQNPDQSIKQFKFMTELFPLVPISEAASKYRLRIIYCTPKAYHDPYHILKNGGLEEDAAVTPQFTVITRHAMEDPNKRCELCPAHIVDAFPHGHPSMDADVARTILDPVVQPKDVFKRYDEYLANPSLGEQLFWQDYMCLTRSPEDLKIKGEWIEQQEMGLFSLIRRRIIVLDDASKDFQQVGRGDYSVALFGEFNEEGRLMLLHGLRSNRWTKDEFIRSIVGYCEAAGWWPQLVVKEKVTVDPFLSDIRRKFAEAAHPVRAVPIPRNSITSKNDWILAAVQGPLERNDCFFRHTIPKEIFDRLRYELINLGQVAHDDVADAFALFFAPEVRIQAPMDLHRISGPAITPPEILGSARSPGGKDPLGQSNSKVAPPVPHSGPFSVGLDLMGDAMIRFGS